MRCIRLVVADQHPVILHGLSSALEVQSDFRVVARCGDYASYNEAIRKFLPDIAILGISAAKISASELLTIANPEGVPTRLVLFTASVEDHALRMLAAAGAYAVIRDDVDLETLAQILRRVADGQRLLPLPSFVGTASREQRAVMQKSVTALTGRERQIVRLVSEGLSNKEIGRRLDLTDGTIKVHVHHILQKLEVGNRTALAALAMSQDDYSESVPKSPISSMPDFGESTAASEK